MYRGALEIFNIFDHSYSLYHSRTYEINVATKHQPCTIRNVDELIVLE
jgi:hypothetical protein